MNSRFFRAAFLVAAVMVAFGALAGMTAAASPPGTAALAPSPARVAAVACSWEQFDTLGRANAFAAGAYNGTAHTVFTYGGMNSNEEPANDVQEIHFPDADVNNAQVGMVGGSSGAKDLFGAAGAHDGATTAVAGALLDASHRGAIGEQRFQNTVLDHFGRSRDDTFIVYLVTPRKEGSPGLGPSRIVRDVEESGEHERAELVS